MKKLFSKILIIALALSLLLPYVGVRPARAEVSELGVIVVNTGNDLAIDVTQTPSTACTLRMAIISANRNRGLFGCASGVNDQDVILISSNIQKLYLSIAPDANNDWYGGDLDIVEGVTITGNPNAKTPATRTTITIQKDLVTWSERIFHIYADTKFKGGAPVTTVNLRNLRIENGEEFGNGAGISLLSGTLNLVNADVSSNQTFASGGAIFVGPGTFFNARNLMVTDNYAASGGGMVNKGTSSVSEAYFGGNVATDSQNGSGGGILNNPEQGGINVVNATFEDNTAARGGAIYSTSPIAIYNSTFVSNESSSAQAEAAAITVTGDGVIGSSIVLQKATQGATCYIKPESSFSSMGYNIEDQGACRMTATGDTQNLTNYAAILQDTLAVYWNGSMTKMFRPAPPPQGGESPVIGKAHANCQPHDQRGQYWVRPGSPAYCDIGAVELNAINTYNRLVLPVIFR